MADAMLAENRRLKAENEGLRKELDQLKQQMLGQGGGDSSWTSFKKLMPSARKSIVAKHKIREGPKEIEELMEAAKDGDCKEIERILAMGVPVDAPGTAFGETALHISSSWGHTRAVELLIANRADVDSRDENGESALFKAAEWNRIETVQKLVDRGARIDLPVKRSKMTALMVAAKLGHKDVCVLLIQEGASVRMADSNGQTAIDVANTANQQYALTAMQEAVDKRRKSKKIDPNQL